MHCSFTFPAFINPLYSFVRSSVGSFIYSLLIYLFLFFRYSFIYLFFCFHPFFCVRSLIFLFVRSSVDRLLPFSPLHGYIGRQLKILVCSRFDYSSTGKMELYFDQKIVKKRQRLKYESYCSSKNAPPQPSPSA